MLSHIAQRAVGIVRSVHRSGVGPGESSLGQRGLAGAHRRLVAVQVGVGLDELHAAAMAVHVAEAADVHQDVEPEALPGGKRPRQLVVRPAMLHPERDNLRYRVTR